MFIKVYKEQNKSICLSKFEDYACSIAKMKKNQRIDEIRSYDGIVRSDFTDEYLERVSLERLKHICLAFRINSKVSKR